VRSAALGDALDGVADGGELVPHAATIRAVATITAPGFDPAINDPLPIVATTPDGITMLVSAPLVVWCLRLVITLV